MSAMAAPSSAEDARCADCNRIFKMSARFTGTTPVCPQCRGREPQEPAPHSHNRRSTIPPSLPLSLDTDQHEQFDQPSQPQLVSQGRKKRIAQKHAEEILTGQDKPHFETLKLELEKRLRSDERFDPKALGFEDSLKNLVQETAAAALGEFFTQKGSFLVVALHILCR